MAKPAQQAGRSLPRCPIKLRGAQCFHGHPTGRTIHKLFQLHHLHVTTLLAAESGYAWPLPTLMMLLMVINIGKPYETGGLMGFDGV